MNPGLAARYYEAIVAASYCTDPELRDRIYRSLCDMNEIMLHQAAIENQGNGQTKPRRRKNATEEVADQVTRRV